MIVAKYETIQVPTKLMTGIERLRTTIEGIPVIVDTSNAWKHPYKEVKFCLADGEYWYLSKEGAREFADLFTELANLLEQP